MAGASADRSTEQRRGLQSFIGDGAARLLGVMGALRRDENNRVTARDLYAQGEAEVVAGWTATLGLRSGRINFRSDNRYIVGANGDDSGLLAYCYTNPVAALQWRSSPELNAYIRVARGFESPTFNELAYRPDGEPGFRSALKAQTSRQLEVALEARGQGRLPVNDANSDFAAGHGLLGLRALWRAQLGAGRLELLGRVDNLADRRVIGSVIVNEVNQRFFEPAAGRTLLISARWVQPF